MGLSKRVSGVLDTPRRPRERTRIMTRIPALIASPGRWASALAPALALAAACSDSTGPSQPISTDVTLAPAEYALYAGAQATGTLGFPAASGGAQYLVVAQFATSTVDLHGGFTLSGSLAAAPVGPFGAAPLAELTGTGGDLASRFHDRLRQLEAGMSERSRAAVAGGLVPAAAPSFRVVAAPPPVGDVRSFKVCANLDCASLDTVTATAQYVGQHAAIYVDDAVPANGFTPTDLSQIGQQFDADLYPVDHTALGSESDIDNNGVVIILLTPKVNALIGKPDCQTSFVTGFFFGADIDPLFRARYNNGEVFYGFVPDPLGQVSCAYSKTLVRRAIVVTFIHEFQHMISYNQHVLVRGGTTEILWLNEALSHLAEELGGRHYDSLGMDTTASQFLIGDLYNAGKYLMNPSAVAMVTDSPPGDLPQRGGAWLFVRYLTDRFGTQTTPHALVNTSLRGAANVAQVAGVAFPTLLGRWALAVYTSDLSGFTAPAELRYENWHFRTTFADLHTQSPTDFPRTFPLVPAAATSGTVAVTGTLRSGSGSYVLVTQPAGGAAFTLTLRSVTGFPSGASPQLAVVRLQ
jgi:hypothetical protein